MFVHGRNGFPAATATMLLLAVSCASVGGTKVTEPLVADLSVFRTAGVLVEPETSEYAAEAGALAAALKVKLRERGLFESVVDLETACGADLGILILLRHVTRVNEAIPVVFGPRSQMASLTFRVRLMRMRNHSYVGEAVMDGQYAGDEDFPSTTREAVHMAAGQVVAYIESGMRSTGRTKAPASR